MKNVKPLRQYLLPVWHSSLINNEIDVVGVGPLFQREVFIHCDSVISGGDMHLVIPRLVEQIKTAVQIEDKTAASVERTFVNHCIVLVQSRVEETSGLGERK